MLAVRTILPVLCTLLLLAFQDVVGFVALGSQRRLSTRIYLVTEEQVVDALEKAEALSVEALEARKNANALCDRAEEEAEAAACSAKEVEEMFSKQNVAKTFQQLAQVDAVAKSNIDATSLVSRAVKASDEAERLEKMAEEALRICEEKLAQHLIDFPDSPLAE